MRGPNAVALLLMLAIIVAGIAALPLAAANPDTCTWNNASANGLWGTAGNWSCGHVPANGDDVVFDATSSTPVSINVLTANLATFTVSLGYTSTITLNADQCNGVNGIPDVCPTPRGTWGAVTTGSPLATLALNGHILHVGSIVMSSGNLDASGGGNVVDDGTWDTAGSVFTAGGSAVWMTSLVASSLKSDNPFNELDLIGDGSGTGSLTPGQQVTMQSGITIGVPTGAGGQLRVFEARTLNTNGHLLKATDTAFGTGLISVFGGHPYGATLVAAGATVQASELQVSKYCCLGAVGPTYDAKLVMDGATVRSIEDLRDLTGGGNILLNAWDFSFGSGSTTHFIWHMTESAAGNTARIEFGDLGTNQNGACTTDCYKLYRNDVLIDEEATGTGSAPDSVRFDIVGGWAPNDKMEFVSPASSGGPGVGTFSQINIQYNSCIQVTLKDTRPEAANGILWVWNWGDGTEQTTTSVPEASHAYVARDVYTIQVTVQDRSGRIDKFVGPLDLTGPICLVQPIAQIVGPYILGILILMVVVLLLQVAISRTNKYTRWLLVTLVIAAALVIIFLYFGWAPALPGGIQFALRGLK